MKKRFFIQILAFTFYGIISPNTINAQVSEVDYDKHGVVWSGGLFKSWLKDKTVDFHQIGDVVYPIFEEEKKTGLAINSHYMYKPTAKFGIGIHLGLGLDLHSYIEAPVLLFGGSISYGKQHQFIVNFGWADARRKKVTGTLRNLLESSEYTEIPTIHPETELNTGYFLGISYRIF